MFTQIFNRFHMDKSLVLSKFKKITFGFGRLLFETSLILLKPNKFDPIQKKSPIPETSFKPKSPVKSSYRPPPPIEPIFTPSGAATSKIAPV